MKTIKTFDNPIDAHLLKTKLESEGIFCYLADENIIGVNPLLSNAVGGIKLNVPDESVEDALRIILETEDTPISNTENQTISCPKCGSTHIFNNINNQKGLFAKLATVLSFLTSSLPIYANKSYLCKDCNTIFDQ